MRSTLNATVPPQVDVLPRQRHQLAPVVDRVGRYNPSASTWSAASKLLASPRPVSPAGGDRGPTPPATRRGPAIHAAPAGAHPRLLARFSAPPTCTSRGSNFVRTGLRDPPPTRPSTAPPSRRPRPQRCGPPARVPASSTGRTHQPRDRGAVAGGPGRLHKEIAERLGISPKTASNHTERSYARIGATNRAMADLSAVRDRRMAADDVG